MDLELFYLSGTGNSLHAARELQMLVPGTALIPMARLADQPVIVTKAETVGLAFPLHFMAAPSVVMDTLKRLDLSETRYFFAIATRQGTPCGRMVVLLERELRKKGKELNAFLAVNLANNDPKFKDWKSAAPEELARLESVMREELKPFAEAINHQLNYRERDAGITFPVAPMMEKLGVIAIQLTGDGKELFYHDEKCTGCGTCEDVCLSRKIGLVQGKPVWQKGKKCYSCYACINFCPAQSIQLKSSLVKFHTQENGRYSHPYATIEDIRNQK